MNTQEFLRKFKELQTKQYSILEKKNSDYANSNDSPFRNFDLSAEIVGITPEQGLLVRICDKVLRIANILEKETNAVEQESILDTLDDLSNYSNLLQLRITDDE